MTSVLFLLILLAIAGISWLVYSVVFRFDVFVKAQERRAAVYLRRHGALQLDGTV